MFKNKQSGFNASPILSFVISCEDLVLLVLYQELKMKTLRVVTSFEYQYTIFVYSIKFKPLIF